MSRNLIEGEGKKGHFRKDICVQINDVMNSINPGHGVLGGNCVCRRYQYGGDYC